MARFFITFILCLSFIQGFSQEHLMFLGLPIDGTVNEYAAKLKLKGFSVSPKNEYASKGLRVVQGPFLGKTEEFGLHYDTDTKKMYSVTFVREFYSEEEAKELYDKLVSLLHEKHDDAKYKSPLSGSHIYSCSFQSDKGIISLAVQLHDYEYRVKMTYCDRINVLVDNLHNMCSKENVSLGHSLRICSGMASYECRHSVVEGTYKRTSKLILMLQLN